MALEVAGFVGTVDQVQFANMMRFVTYSGVEDLQLTPVLDADRTVRVSFSRTAVPGVTIRQTAPMNVTLPVNPSTNSRRDRIILRYDWQANNGLGQATLTSKPGTPAPNPVWPPLEADAGRLWEQSLGRVTVGPGQGVLAPGDIIASGVPRNSPVITLDDETGLPFAHARALVIDPSNARMRVSDGSQYHDILPANIEWTAVSQPSNWSGTVRYARRGGMITVRGATDRATPRTDSAELLVATLPVAARPAFDVFTVGYQRRTNTNHYFGMVIETTGAVRVITRSADPDLVAGGVWLRFCVSYPVF